jgi:hypothetical protein
LAWHELISCSSVLNNSNNNFWCNALVRNDRAKGAEALWFRSRVMAATSGRYAPLAAEEVENGGSVLVVSAPDSPPSPVTLPSSTFATSARYLEQGDDLVLVGQDGSTVVIPDYFVLEPLPDLLTPEGGKVTPELVRSFLIPEAAGQVAQLGSALSEPIGQVMSAV